MGALTFPGKMKGCWRLKEEAHAAEMACHNTRWIKEHGGREKQEVYEEALFSPLSVYMSQGDLGRFVSHLIKKFCLNPEKLKSWYSFFKTVCNSF